jgi:hypothetical protein
VCVVTTIFPYRKALFADARLLSASILRWIRAKSWRNGQKECRGLRQRYRESTGTANENYWSRMSQDEVRSVAPLDLAASPGSSTTSGNLPALLTRPLLLDLPTPN